MGRPRAFDTDQAVRAAAALFATCGYAGTSIDDLTTATGMHRGSLYNVFGSKRKLYLTALRAHLDHEILPSTAAVGSLTDAEQARAAAIAGFDDGPAAGFLLLAAVERAPQDPEAAELVAEGFTALENALRPTHADEAEHVASTVLGKRLRLRARPTTAQES
ncbi:TetR/AcrR family transcriptional regulator [Streptomyces sp. NPDC006516]|uniref:TetR/AcrR family transcriptional regulator n=1 Tax=Streptomyces sp. NPDC006516 TaxID=3154309 RepID=UPI0033A5458B